MDATQAHHPADQMLRAYGLGTLDEVSAESIENHLESCSDCRRRVAELSSDRLLDRIRDARSRPDLHLPVVSANTAPSMLETGARSSATPPASTLPPGLVDNPDYQITRELGRGGMGVVYLAQNTLMGRREVLKVVSSHLINRRGVMDRFLGEIRNAAKLHHSNIVTAYSALRLGESLVLAMEYVEGLDLAMVVKAKGPLPVANACNFAYQAALGLQHAHEHGMVHRDIKPSNLMLSRQGNRALIKILDFGLAKVQSEGAVHAGLTHEGQMLGTPDYIAPEQIRNARRADIRADIYSLGCTLYYLLSGGPPFHGTSLYDILQAHQSMEATPLNLARPEVPTELAALVAKMMAKEPERRFQEPREVAQALTPFFKKGRAAFKGTNPEISQAGQPEVKPAMPGAVPAPAMTPSPGPVRKTPTEPSQPGSILEGLIDLREKEPLFDTMLDEPRPAGFATLGQPGSWTRSILGATLGQLGPRHWGTAAGVLLFGLVVAWAVGIFKVKTANAVIVLEDLPQQAEVFVDGEKVTLTWPEAKGPAQVVVTAAQHGVEVKTAGIKVFGEQVIVGAGTKKELRIRREILVDSPTRATRAEAAPSDDPKPDQPLAKATGGDWISLFNGKDTTGWKTHPDQPGNWHVKDGILVGSGPSASHLYTVRDDFRDFRLRVEARYNEGGHGGVYVRSSFGPTVPASDPKWPSGYEVLINSTHTGGDRGKTGSIDAGDPKVASVWRSGNAKDVHHHEWFNLEVITDGTILNVLVGGRSNSYHFDHKRLHSGGHIALQQLDPQSVIEFRKIEIQELNRSGEKDAKEIRRFVGHEGRVRRVVFSPDEHTIMSGGHSQQWELTDAGNSFVPRGKDNFVRLWETETGRNTLVEREHGTGIESVAYSSDGRYALSSSNWSVSLLIVWDLKTGREIHRFSRKAVANRPSILAAVFSADGRKVTDAFADGTLQAWDLDSREPFPLLTLKGGKFDALEFTCATFSPDGQQLVTGSRRGTVELWDLRSGKSLQTLTGHTGEVRAVSRSADGRLILSGCSDKTVRLWDVASGQELRSFQGDGRDLRCVAISPDGRRALSGGNDAEVRLWDLSTGREICRLQGHTMGINTLAFSKDGRRALSGSDDSKIILWALPDLK